MLQMARFNTQDITRDYVKVLGVSNRRIRRMVAKAIRRTAARASGNPMPTTTPQLTKDQLQYLMDRAFANLPVLIDGKPHTFQQRVGGWFELVLWNNLALAMTLHRNKAVTSPEQIANQLLAKGINADEARDILRILGYKSRVSTQQIARVLHFDVIALTIEGHDPIAWEEPLNLPPE
jgi:hypothetical protein